MEKVKEIGGYVDFTATDHALLFAWLSRATIQRAGRERGEAVVREAVRRYGTQRGRRMALRAQANGHPLTMAGYLAFGEWQAGSEEMSQTSEAQGPDLLARVQRCPWHRAWEDYDLMPYGRIYCLDIDEALVRGFNPELQLDVRATLSGGDDGCEFVFHHVEWGPGSSGRVVMPWEYHLGHLFRVVRDVLAQDLGELGKAAADEALGEFAAHRGQEAAQAVAKHRDTDFDRLPELEGDSATGGDPS